MKTAIYRRISRDHQDTKSQTRAIFDWLAANGLTRGGVRWFTDRGVSSAKTSRPAFDRMMEALDKGSVKRIVVYKLDRIGRWESDDFLTWRIRLRRAKVELVSLTETNTGFDSLADKIIALVIAEADRLWLEGHRKRIKAGIKAKRKAGQPWGIGLRTPKPDKNGRLVGTKVSPQEWAALAARVKAGEDEKAVHADSQTSINYFRRKMMELGARTSRAS